MKNITLAAALLLALGSAAFAQTNEEKRDKKLAAEFFKKATWFTDYDKAREEAKKSGKPIFAFFTRSYAPCPPCLALEGGPLISEEFVKFAKDYVLFCHITTHIDGDKYADLLEQKGGQGFPHLVFLDAEGTVLAEHKADRTAEAFAETGKKAKNYLDVKAKAEKGDKSAQVDLLLAQLEMGQIKAAEAEKKFKDATPTKEQEAKFAGLLVNVSVLQEVEALENKTQEQALAKKYYENFKAGKPGPTSDEAMQPYYVLSLTYAEEQKDVTTFESALKVLKDKFGKVEAAKGFFEAKEKKLEELKKK